MTWGFIVRNPVMVDVLDEELGRIVRLQDPLIKVRRRSGDESWFDEHCWTTSRSWRSKRTHANRVLFR